MKTYSIRQDPVRQRKGLKSWGVFEQVSPDFWQGVAQFYTMQEALAAKKALEKDEKAGCAAMAALQTAYR